MAVYGNACEPEDGGAQAIVDLHVKCSLRVRNLGAPGFAASDCCGHPGVSAVQMPDGDFMWRCGDPDHEGLRWLHDDPARGAHAMIGPVVTHIVTRSSLG